MNIAHTQILNRRQKIRVRNIPNASPQFQILLDCPTSAKEIDGSFLWQYGDIKQSETTRELVRVLYRKNFRLPQCPHCGNSHDWKSPYDIVIEE